MEEGILFECMRAPDFSVLQEFLSPPCLEPVDDPEDLVPLDGMALPSMDCCLHTSNQSHNSLTGSSRPFPPADGGCAGPRACDRFLSNPFGPEAEAGPAASCDWPESSYQVPELTMLCLLEEAAKLDPLITSSASQTSPGSAEKHGPNTDLTPPSLDSPPVPTPGGAMVEVLSPSVGAGSPLHPSPHTDCPPSPLPPSPHTDCPTGPCVWSGRLSGSAGWCRAARQVRDGCLMVDGEFGEGPVPGGVSPGAGSESRDPTGRSSSGEGGRGQRLGVDTRCRSNFPQSGVRMTSPSYSRTREPPRLTDWSRAGGNRAVSGGRQGLERPARDPTPGQQDPGGVYRQAANGEQGSKLAGGGKGQRQADRDPDQAASTPGPGPTPGPGLTPTPGPGSTPTPGPGGSSSHGQDSGPSVAATIRKRTPRKQAAPRRSAEQGDPTFEGVTLRMERQLVSDWDCRLQITAHYSPGLRQKLGRIRNLRDKSGVQGSAFSSSEEDTDPNTVQGKRCASCNTLKTPLWRDAEDGTPLCNACGIRYKKYRIRCSKCWHIPKKEGKSFVRCPRCGDTLRLLANQRKVTNR